MLAADSWQQNNERVTPSFDKGRGSFTAQRLGTSGIVSSTVHGETGLANSIEQVYLCQTKILTLTPTRPCELKLSAQR